jgi:hypothetical protein
MMHPERVRRQMPKSGGPTAEVSGIIDALGSGAALVTSNLCGLPAATPRSGYGGRARAASARRAREGSAILQSPADVIPSTCGSGGTGRRASLRSLWPQGRGGSSPLFRTNARFVQKIRYSAGLRPQVVALRPRLHHTRAPCGVVHWLILHLPAPLVTMRPTPVVQVLHGGNYLSHLQPRHHNVWSRECADLHRCGSCTEYGIHQQGAAAKHDELACSRHHDVHPSTRTCAGLGTHPYCRCSPGTADMSGKCIGVDRCTGDILGKYRPVDPRKVIHR